MNAFAIDRTKQGKAPNNSTSTSTQLIHIEWVLLLSLNCSWKHISRVCYSIKNTTQNLKFTLILSVFFTQTPHHIFFSMHINEKKYFYETIKYFIVFPIFILSHIYSLQKKNQNPLVRKKNISWQIFNIFRFSCFLAKESMKSFFSIFNLLQTNIANKMIQMKNVMTFVLGMNGFSFSIWENLSFSFFGVRCREWKSLEVFKFCLWKF